MRIAFLGTAAANAYPEAFCRCANCDSAGRARALGGRRLRKRSALLVNDDLLVDLGPDIMTAAQVHGIRLTNVRYCRQIHAHADHFDVSHLLSRGLGYGVVGAPCLHFYGPTGTLRVAAERLRRNLALVSLFDPEVGERLNLEIHQIGALQSFDVGPYRVTAFPANHDPIVDPLLYAVSAEGCTLFCGVDTASLPEETWQTLRRHPHRFDVVILDHSYGPNEEGSEHLSARDLISHARRMRKDGLLVEGARVFATQVAHEGNPAHPELAAFAPRRGYEVAYDGLTVELGSAHDRKHTGT